MVIGVAVGLGPNDIACPVIEGPEVYLPVPIRIGFLADSAAGFVEGPSI